MTRARRVVLLLSALAALAAAWLLPARHLLTRALEIAQAAGPWGAIVYGLAYVLACVLLFPATLLTLGAGFLYGPWLGIAVVLPASVLGATAAFLVARHLARDAVAARVKGHRVFEAVDRAVARRGFRTVLLVRLTPVLPFNLLNYGLGLTSVRLRDYVLGSAIGMLPAIVLVVHAGSLVTSLGGLGEAAPTGRARAALLIAGLAALVALVVVTGRAARRALREDIEP